MKRTFKARDNTEITKTEQIIRLFFGLFNKDRAMKLLEEKGIILQNLPDDLKEKYIIYKKRQQKRLKKIYEKNIQSSR